MSEKKLPGKLFSVLENEGITPETILAYSPIDLSFACEYVYGYVFLTENYLGVATSAPISSHIIYMKGTQKKDDVSYEEETEYTYRLYDVAKVEKLHREHMVATNLICMEYEGRPVRVAAHSNLYLADMEAFLKKYKQFIKGEQITEEEEAEEQEELYCPVCGTKYPDRFDISSGSLECQIAAAQILTVCGYRLRPAFWMHCVISYPATVKRCSFFP